MSDPVWAILWVICGCIVGLLEYVALVRPAEGDTLSENLRTKVRQHQWFRWTTLACFAVFSLWFAWHIWFD